jgi:hypothetical protein
MAPASRKLVNEVLGLAHMPQGGMSSEEFDRRKRAVADKIEELAKIDDEVVQMLITQYRLRGISGLYNLPHRVEQALSV